MIYRGQDSTQGGLCRVQDLPSQPVGPFAMALSGTLWLDCKYSAWRPQLAEAGAIQSFSVLPSGLSRTAE